MSSSTTVMRSVRLTTMARVRNSKLCNDALGLCRVQYAAFFSDSRHEVLPVTSGVRVSLTYSLYVEEGQNKSDSQSPLLTSLASYIKVSLTQKAVNACCASCASAKAWIMTMLADFLITCTNLYASKSWTQYPV